MSQLEGTPDEKRGTDAHAQEESPLLAAHQRSAAHQPGNDTPLSVIHFSSLSVNYFAPSNKAVEPIRVSLKLVERDLGAANDFWNIQLNLVIHPRAPADPISVSVDHLLTLRHTPTPLPATIRLHARGAAPIATFAFPNGPDACQAFLLALRNHIVFRLQSDPYRPGTLYTLEAKPRMRRVAPSLMPMQYPQPGDSLAESGTRRGKPDDEFAALLADLNIKSSTGPTSKPVRVPNNAQSPHHNVAMSLLSQFARVTQAARDVGDHIALMLDEDKRKAQEQQQNNLQSARTAALDIHAAIVASTNNEHELPPRLTLDTIRGLPILRTSWLAMLDAEGRLTDPLVIKHAVFSGGIHSALRPTLWPFLLGFYPWLSSEAERNAILEKARKDYVVLKAKTQSLRQQALDTNAQDGKEVVGKANGESEEQIATEVLKVHGQIAKDVVRTDRTLKLFEDDEAPAITLMATLLNVYACHNPTISYCQGMSDFLAPLIHELGLHDEALLFWCFEKLMGRMEANFRIDQSGMHAQLAKLKQIVRAGDKELAEFFDETDPEYYSCFRWIVVRFKRELAFEGTTRLWEVLWSRQVGGEDLHIYVAAGLLFAHRTRLLALRRGAFDCLLRYINDMSMRIDVDFAIHEGASGYRRLAEAVS